MPEIASVPGGNFEQLDRTLAMLQTRYLTVGGTTVCVWEATEWAPVRALCSGCGQSSDDGGPDSSQPDRWAQSHAETCRALPRPTA